MFVCSSCGQRFAEPGRCGTDGTELEPSSDPLLGTEIVRYRLARLLGEGGMGRVYLAVQPTIGSRVAIKVLSEECTRNPELIERFFAEAKAVNLIRHENIVSVLDLAVLPDGRPFIIMEFIEGYTLAHYVRNTQAPLGGVAHVIGEVLSGLAAAHAIGIVHRDLKPDNVLVTVEGHAKVLDFGIAKLAPSLRADVSPRTKTGALLGTPAYMAPEQITGSGHVDARTDVYAMGIVLYEAVTGTQPFAGETLFDMMRSHLEVPPPPPRQRRPDLPAAMEQVILQALAKHPEHRYQTATAMAQALASAATSLPPDQWRPLSSRGGPRFSFGQPTTDRQGEQRSTAIAPSTQTQRKRRGLLIGGIATGLVGIGALLFVLLGQGSSNASAPPASAPTVAHEMPAPTPAPAPTVAHEMPAPTPAPAPAAGAEPAPATHTTPAKPAVKAVAQPAVKPAPPPPKPAVVVPPNSGVSIGSNVHIGSNVIIGQNPPSPPPTAKNRISKPADYNAKSFDPVAYLPKAQALAQQLIPDAKLTNFEFDPVYPDGHVDLTVNGRDHEYNFRSVVNSARPANVARNIPIERPCMVHIEVEAHEVTAVIRTTEDCDDKLVRWPRCHLAGVWKQAQAAGVPTDLVARIGWLFDEKWFFDIDFEGKGGGVSSFADRCN